MQNLRPKTKACKAKEVSPELQDYFDVLYKFKDGYSQGFLQSLCSKADHLAKFMTRKAWVREATENSIVTQREILPVAELLCRDGRICVKDTHLCSIVNQVIIVNCDKESQRDIRAHLEFAKCHSEVSLSMKKKILYLYLQMQQNVM